MSITTITNPTKDQLPKAYNTYLKLYAYFNTFTFINEIKNIDEPKNLRFAFSEIIDDKDNFIRHYDIDIEWLKARCFEESEKNKAISNPMTIEICNQALFIQSLLKEQYRMPELADWLTTVAFEERKRLVFGSTLKPQFPADRNTKHQSF